MTYDEMKKAIEVLTSEIRTLSYSSTKEAAEKILQLQRRRRELRAQLEAAESKDATSENALSRNL
jgi:hypothetical protein